MSDSIHPNDRGYAMIADRIEPAVRDLLESD
jgi:lysophospholipase L1-like esterase